METTFLISGTRCGCRGTTRSLQCGVSGEQSLAVSRCLTRWQRCQAHRAATVSTSSCAWAFARRPSQRGRRESTDDGCGPIWCVFMASARLEVSINKNSCRPSTWAGSVTLVTKVFDFVAEPSSAVAGRPCQGGCRTYASDLVDLPARPWGLLTGRRQRVRHPRAQVFGRLRDGPVSSTAGDVCQYRRRGCVESDSNSYISSK